MPTYEYACKDCGRHLEVVQSFSDEPLTKCEVCGGQLRKVFGSVGIVFKGSGFYKTDSRSGSSLPAAKNTAADQSSSPVASETPKKDNGADSGGSTKTEGTTQASKVKADSPAPTSPTKTADKVPAAS